MEWIAAVAASAHFGLGIAAASLAFGVTLVGGFAALGGRVRRRTVDQVIALQIFVVGGAVVIGPLLLATQGLGDLLHGLYALVALVALPLARVLAVPPPVPGEPKSFDRGSADAIVDRRLGRWLALAGLVTLGSLLRLAMTG